MNSDPLPREELIEQVYFFRTYRERLAQNLPAQEILETIREEILATTRMPFAIDFLYDEIKLHGKISTGMERLSHYFRPFQTCVMSAAEEDKARFDLPIALQILEREAEYLCGEPKPAGLFIFQFECISRNRIGYEAGLTAISEDPFFSQDWREWVKMVKRSLGTRNFSDFIYLYSEFALGEHRRQQRDEEATLDRPMLFDVQEGRIAKANRSNDPLYMFAALQRHLNYPIVPRSKGRSDESPFPPALEARLTRIEKRIQLIEMEQKNSVDLSEFYQKPTDFGEETSP
ncbi:hypothetical protein OAF24_00665 [bacterium]|jgi:hypothetical protein|nr:hypothetical protein [bacterium]